jgi:hypothetical protein
MTAPDRMPEAFENSLHDAGHPHMEPPANPGRFTSRPRYAAELSLRRPAKCPPRSRSAVHLRRLLMNAC